MRINDQAYYTKGSNLTPAQVFFGAITDDEQRTLVDLAAEANFNTLRVWGGGIVNGEAFFDRCDQRGIVVWQDFPLANRNYAQTDPYLAVLDQDARAIVRRLAPHPCLGMWCGGNELTSHMKPLESHPAIVRLAGICAELDPRTPFIPTDPWYGFKHSPYAFRDWRRAEGEIFAQFIAAQEVARTEFGISAPAPLAVLQRILPADKLTWSEALLADASWQYHKGFLAIDKNERYWFDTSTVEHYWGPMTDLTTMVGRAQWLQAEGLRFCHEELRRQRPGCAAALTWCFNEPWTCAANNSLLSWPAVPKPAYAAVQSALRDRLASARVAKFQWTPGERFTAQLFVCNDRFTALPPGTVTLRLRSGDWQQACEPWSHARVAGNTTLAGPTCTIDLPTTLGSDLVVELESGSGGYSNAYRLATKTVTTAPQ
jgi:beta-mannosidase